MKKLILAVGLSLTVLLPASFAQVQKKGAVPPAPAFTMVKAQTRLQGEMNAPTSEKFGIDKFVKQATAATKGVPAIRHIGTYALEDPEKVKLTLRVNIIWGDGSGYHMLIDKDATICDNIDPTRGLDQKLLPEIYEGADFSVPANAEPNGDAILVFGEEESIEVEPGVYDVIVLNPTLENEGEEDEGWWIYKAGGKGLLNDFEFVKGNAYIFEVYLNVNTDNVDLIGPNDLTANALEFPASCEIDDEAEVKVTITNRGTAPLQEFVLGYSLASGNPEVTPDTVEQTFTESLEPGQTTTVTFTQKLTGIEKGKLYTVNAFAKPLEGELNVNDNATRGCFVRNDGLSDLPYEFDMADYDFFPALPNAWLIDETNGFAQANLQAGVPLVSNCFELESGKPYRLSYEYWAGQNYMGAIRLAENYHIGLGLISQPVSEWDTLLLEKNVYIEEWTAQDVLFTPQASGTYSICFSGDVRGYMGVRKVMITDVVDYDARLNSFSTILPRLTIPKQINGSVAAFATVENRGRLDIEEATLSVKLNGTALTEVKVSGIESGDSEDVELSLNISGLKTGDKAVFTANVALEGEAEANCYDNTQTVEVEVGDYVMAYDYVTEDMYERKYAIGASASISCGIPFTLMNKDTLTAVSLGWSELENDMEIGIRIEKWNKETQTLGDMIYEIKVLRGKEAGQREYEVPSLVLEAGDYMISAVQYGNISYYLISDFSETGSLYVTAYNPPALQTDLGTPAIRAVFGPDAKPVEKDVYVMEITKPKEKGVFAENQEVTVKVSNKGYKAVSAPISLMVDGKVVDTKTVELAAYSSGMEVTFIADLSAPETDYVLTVFSALEGDEDLSNDTCTKTVHSVTPADPYVMDFEYCDAFATDGFNPVWKTVDADGEITYPFQEISFPHMGEPFGFIVFNPSTIGQSANEPMKPHGGAQYGATFATRTGSNDDWLISPKLKIVEGKEYMNFFVKSLTDEYGLEEYNVLISTTDDNLESFEQIGDTREAPADAWEEVNIDLTEYSGKEVYLAIQVVSYDLWVFMIDDITVGKEDKDDDGDDDGDDVATEKVAPLESLLSLYPNPASEMIYIYAQDAKINQVSIFNTSGTMVYQSKDLNTANYRYSVKGLNSGLYFARVLTDRGIVIMKFVVQ